MKTFRLLAVAVLLLCIALQPVQAREAPAAALPAGSADATLEDNSSRLPASSDAALQGEGRLAWRSSPGLVKTGTLTLNDGDNLLQTAVIDPAAGFAYFGTMSFPGRIAKVRLSDMSRVASLTLNPGEDNVTSAVIDPAAGFAYFGTNTYPGIIVKVRLSDFTRVGAITLNNNESAPFSAVIDPAAGFAYFGTAGNRIVKIALASFSRARRAATERR